MSDSFEIRYENGMNEAVRKKIAELLRPNADYLKAWIPEIRKVPGEGKNALAYAVTVRWKVPDAYFDASGNFLFSVSGVLEFDGWPNASPSARDALRLSEFRVAEQKNGNVWYRESGASKNPDGKATESVAIDPFSPEAFQKIREVAFHQDRIDIARREYAKGVMKNDLLPYADADIEALVSAKTITISDFVKLKKIGLVSEKTFSKYKKAVSRLLPEQILDARFSKSIRVKGANGEDITARPSWHGIDRSVLDSLSHDGHVDGPTYKAVLDSFETLRRRSEAFGTIVNGSKPLLSSLKDEIFA